MSREPGAGPVTGETSLSIRAAAIAERAETVALWQRCGLTVSYNDPGQDFDLAQGKTGSDVLVGTCDGRIVAACMVGHDGHRGWLYYVGVDPDYRHRGFGEAIVRAGERWLSERGIPKIMLMVRETNTAVEGFYHAIGYETAPRIVLQKWLKR